MRKLHQAALVAALLGRDRRACRPSAASAAASMTIGRYADSLFLDPVLNDANVDIWILTNLYDTLLQPTADGKGVSRAWPRHGRSPTTALTVTLTLREGVKFADGTPITAEDVKWSLDRARDPEERHLELPARLDRQRRRRRRRHDRRSS